MAPPPLLSLPSCGRIEGADLHSKSVLWPLGLFEILRIVFDGRTGLLFWSMRTHSCFPPKKTGIWAPARAKPGYHSRLFCFLNLAIKNKNNSASMLEN